MSKPNVISARVSRAVLDYREEVVRRTGIKKRYFDEQVYREYMENHPIDADSGDGPPREEPGTE